MDLGNSEKPKRNFVTDLNCGRLRNSAAEAFEETQYSDSN